MTGTFSFPEGGLGAGRAVRMQAKGLAEGGHDVLVATCRGGVEKGKESLEGFRIRNFAPLRHGRCVVAAGYLWCKGQLGMLVYLLYAIVSKRFDSIVFHDPAPVFALVSLVGRGLRRHTCFVAGDLHDPAERPLLAWAERILFKHVSLIIVAGSPLLEKYVARIAPTTLRVRLFPPTDSTYFAAGDANRAKNALVLGEGRMIVYAGAVSRLEGIDVLLRAMAKVIVAVPDVTLAIAGPVLAWDPVCGEPIDYRRLVEGLGLVEKVRLLGVLELSAVADLMAAATVLINPKVDHRANRAAAPIKLGEYLASGRPVVSTNVCQLDEWLVDGRDVVFCRAGDAGALADGVIAVLTDVSLAERLSVNGPKIAREACDYRAWGRKVTEAIEASDGFR
jgi:glycosyltransferase involved in cell wall biosynthesis